MLNLLIAIISDIFNKVKNAEELTKIWEKCNLLTEIDAVSSQWKRKEDKNYYLLFLYNKGHFDDHEENSNDKTFNNEIKNTLSLILNAIQEQTEIINDLKKQKK